MLRVSCQFSRTFCFLGSVKHARGRTAQTRRLRSGWVRPPDVQSEARTSSWSVASVGPPAASGLSLGEAYVAASVATNAHPRFQSLVHFSAIAQPQEDELLNHISSSSSARTERYDAFVARLRPAPEGLEAGCAEVREDWACSLVFLAWHRWARQRLSLLHLFRRSSRRDLSGCSSHSQCLQVSCAVESQGEERGGLSAGSRRVQPETVGDLRLGWLCHERLQRTSGCSTEGGASVSCLQYRCSGSVAVCGRAAARKQTLDSGK